MESPLSSEQRAADERRLSVDARQVVHELVDGELILIHLGRGNYFSLSGTGPQIWSLLSAGVSPAEVIASLAALYPDDAEAITAAVGELVDRLLAEEILVPVGEASPPDETPTAAPADRPPAAAPSGSFEAPRLEKYTDMQDYLLIDPIHEVEQPGWPQRRQAPDGVGADPGGAR